METCLQTQMGRSHVEYASSLQNVQQYLSDAGRLNGELTIKAHDAKTWAFPSMFGRVRCQDTAFHFWDAMDDFSQAQLELLFEDQRLYLHNSSGRFGAIPLTVTGSPSRLGCLRLRQAHASELVHQHLQYLLLIARGPFSCCLSRMFPWDTVVTRYDHLLLGHSPCCHRQPFHV